MSEIQKGPSRVKNAFRLVQKWWKRITALLITLLGILGSLHQIHLWPFNQAKESPNQSVVATNNGTIGQVNGPVLQYFNFGGSSPFPQSSPHPSTPIVPLPTASSSEGPSSISSTPIDLDKSLSEGLKEVFRAIPSRFRKLREKALEGGTSLIYKGSFVFGGATFAECLIKNFEDGPAVVRDNYRYYSYTIHYEPSSKEDARRQMDDLHERLKRILVGYTESGEYSMQHGEFYVWESPEGPSNWWMTRHKNNINNSDEPDIWLSMDDVPGGLEAQVSLDVRILVDVREWLEQ